MKNIEEFKIGQVNVFLKLIEEYEGKDPIFSIKYVKDSDRAQGIYLTNASSGFIKVLQKKGAMTHLLKGYLSVNFF
ncbi:MAG: hypothetical protein ACJA1D_000177 [Polaribacter sp.]|jgi:hypothetical protein